MINVTRPVGISFMDWAAAMQIDLSRNLVTLPISEDQWWDWAAQLLIDNDFGAAPLPLKMAYPKSKDWSKWASFFIDSIDSSA